MRWGLQNALRARVEMMAGGVELVARPSGGDAVVAAVLRVVSEEEYAASGQHEVGESVCVERKERMS